MLDYLGEADYTGIDADEETIAAHAGSIGREVIQSWRVEGAAAIALLHHLDDAEAEALFRAAAAMLKSGASMTFDCLRLSPQNPIAAFLIALDLGNTTRTREQYVSLAKRSFARIESNLHHDLLRGPYNLCVMVCSRGAQNHRRSSCAPA